MEWKGGECAVTVRDGEIFVKKIMPSFIITF